jgi:ribosomal protein L32
MTTVASSSKTSKEMRPIHKALEAAGFTITYHQGHYTVRNERGARVYTLPGSPSDWRTIKNIKAQLRRDFGVTV